MQRLYQEITPLANDMDYFCAHWGDNKHATEPQKERWPDAKIAHGALGMDDENCIRLLEADGFDDKPVSSRKRTSTRKWFYPEDHLSPPLEDLRRFCVFFHIGFFGTVHLLIKKLWEDFVIKEKKSMYKENLSYIDCVRCFEEHDLNQLINGFLQYIKMTSGKIAIYYILEKYDAIASSFGFTEARLIYLIEQLIHSRCHYVGANSEELHDFIARQEAELALIRQAEHRLVHQHFIEKCKWCDAQDELSERAMEREEVRLKNRTLQMQWMNMFGNEYVELISMDAACTQLEIQITIKQQNSEISDEEMASIVHDAMKGKLENVKDAKEDAMSAAVYMLFGADESSVSIEEYKKYNTDVRKIIGEIFHLTHEDKLQSLGFTESQKNELRNHFENVLRIKNSESCLSKRSLIVLMDILDNVKATYELMGIELRPQGVILGDTLEEQIEWMKNDVARIQRQLSDLRAQIMAMSTNQDILEKVATMASERSREETMQSLRNRLQELQKKHKTLSEKYQKL